MKIILIIIAIFFGVNLFAQMPETNKCPCDYPSLLFTGNVSQLSDDKKKSLAAAAKKLKEQPFCNLLLAGYPAPSKLDQRLCQIRLDIVKRYLVEIQGISSDRIITNCEVGEGNNKVIDIKCDN